LKKKIKHTSLKKLHKKAWKLQSEYIRRAEKGICFTCGRRGEWKEMNAGHYIHGNRMDFDPLNIHCQCPHCNLFLHGNLGIYAERLIAEYGEEAVIRLRERSREEKKFTIFELEALITSFTQRLKEL
jgi:hypothetical protein